MPVVNVRRREKPVKMGLNVFFFFFVSLIIPYQVSRQGCASAQGGREFNEIGETKSLNVKLKQLQMKIFFTLKYFVSNSRLSSHKWN